MDLVNARKMEHIKKKSYTYVASDGLTMQVLQALLEDYAKEHCVSTLSFLATMELQDAMLKRI